jgi:hypothetical protein
MINVQSILTCRVAKAATLVPLSKCWAEDHSSQQTRRKQPGIQLPVLISIKSVVNLVPGGTVILGYVHMY